GRGQQDVARLFEDVLVGDEIGPRESDDAARLLDVLLEGPDIEPLAVPDPALVVAHPLDHGPVAPEHARSSPAHGAEPLDTHLPALDLLAQAVHGLVEHVHDAASRGLAPTRRAAHED